MTIPISSRHRIALATLIIVSFAWDLSYAIDSDGDGLEDPHEVALGCDPQLVDTDGDGISDGREVKVYATDPNLADSDSGGTWDVVELLWHATNPNDSLDDTGTASGQGAATSWLLAQDDLERLSSADQLLASADYSRMRGFVHAGALDFMRDETANFPIDFLTESLFGYNIDDYTGALSGWLYVPATGEATNLRTLALTTESGGRLRIWDGTAIREMSKDSYGLATQTLAVDFPVSGGLFPFDVVTWDEAGKEAIELSWAPGNVTFDPAVFRLVSGQDIAAPHLLIKQYAADVNGGSLEPQDYVELVVAIENNGDAAAYSVRLSPMLAGGATFSSYVDYPVGTAVSGSAATVPFVDANDKVLVRYRVRYTGGTAAVQVKVLAHSAPPQFAPIGTNSIHLISDNPLVNDGYDIGNRPRGYFADGRDDDDPNFFFTTSVLLLDECAQDLHTCDPHATCTDEPGLFSCACNSGYRGDGAACTDIDECAETTHDCDANATCTNSEGSFSCTCNSGFGGDGTECEDIDECARLEADCAPNATCQNNAGSFSCICKAGFEGDGTTCTPMMCGCTEDELCVGGDCYERCTDNSDCLQPEQMCYLDRCAADACAGVQCMNSEVCYGGSCFLRCEGDVDCSNPDHRCYAQRCTSDPCEGVTCASGQVCRGGSCFDTCATSIGCPRSDERCIENRCTTDPCAGIACASGQTCQGGSCFDVCSSNADCPDGELCYADRCTEDPCQRISCPENDVCYGGTCFEQCTGDIDCTNPNHACYDSRCASSPCEGVQCPTGQQCLSGYCYETCASNADCLSGETCDRSLCVQDRMVARQEGCSCSTHSNAPSSLLAAFLGLVLLGGRRLRRRILR